MSALTQVLSAALIHFVWQGSIVGLLLWITLLALRHRPANMLAHVRRHDYLVNIVQMVVETLFFYHPVVWWTSTVIRRERELCCDDLAVRACGDPLGYARALTRLEQLRAATPRFAMGSTGGSLLYRIQRLLSTKPREYESSCWSAACAIALTMLCAVVDVSWVRAQAPADRLRFEVASIKASPPGQPTRDNGGIPTRFLPGGRFSGRNVGLKDLVSLAYRMQFWQISGGPKWIDPDMMFTTDRYLVEADGNDAATPEQIREMLQSLLKDRFKLAVHRETKVGKVYDLVVVRPGRGLQEVRVDTYTGNARMGGGRVITEQMTMRDLAIHLTGQVQTPVTDKTGLTGVYKFTLQWTPDFFRLRGEGRPAENGEGGIDPNGPSLFDAVQEQLGLKLQEARGPIEYLVIDRAERPTED